MLRSLRAFPPARSKAGRLSQFRKPERIQTAKRGYAVAAPAVGSYGPSDEPVLNSPSELARRISAKVLPRLEKPDVKKVLVVGSGGLSIGQAGEFDYSGQSSSSLMVYEKGQTTEALHRITSHKSPSRIKYRHHPHQSQHRYHPNLPSSSISNLLFTRHSGLCSIRPGKRTTRWHLVDVWRSERSQCRSRAGQDGCLGEVGRSGARDAYPYIGGVGRS